LQYRRGTTSDPRLLELFKEYKKIAIIEKKVINNLIEARLVLAASGFKSVVK
jgi:hypothetical protein